MTIGKKAAAKTRAPWIHLQTIEAHETALQKVTGKAKFVGRVYLDSLPPGSQG
ncbi:MAG: hypothetical protein P4N41_16520 [Negativicutes bacterium]|nr:hypothetical protein [Negativicutes bacterium]